VGLPIPVADPADPRLAPFRSTDRQLRLQGGGERGWFLAEGDLVVERAHAARCRPVCALVDPDRVPPVAASLGVPVYAAGGAVRRAATRLGVVQPILAVFERPAPADIAGLVPCDRLVVVQGVDNPSNIGALVRNAAGLGWDGVILDDDSADPLARRSLRVAMGTAFALPWARVDDVAGLVATLAAAGVVTIAMTPAPDAVDLARVRAPARVAIVVGSERAGLSADVQAACSMRVRIPLVPDVDSLNVAAATAIACHHLRP
jgi:tRNA G18 (ribose-2'-O)-methylase SpoU